MPMSLSEVAVLPRSSPTLADGTIPKEQVERLKAIGRWLKSSGEAFFGSRPWVRAEGKTSRGKPVRFTQRIENGTVYANVLGPIPDGSVTIEDFPERPSHMGLLGMPASLTWSIENGALRIMLPGNLPDRPAYSFAISTE